MPSWESVGSAAEYYDAEDAEATPTGCEAEGGSSTTSSPQTLGRPKVLRFGVFDPI